jgi:hypothetical protein
LASNAHDCYHALGKKLGKPSWFQEFTENTPPSFQQRAKYIQDFAKHGFKDADESAPFEAIWADALMLLSIERHGQIFGPPMTPLMALYFTRSLSEHPRWTPNRQSLPQTLIDSGIIEDVAKGSRKECFDCFLPFFNAAHTALS